MAIFTILLLIVATNFQAKGKDFSYWLRCTDIHLSFVNTGDVPVCSQDFLFAVSQETGGVGLSLIFDKNLPYTSSEAQSHLQATLQGQFSSACGDNFFRCKDPLILTTQHNTFIQYLIFVPLEDGLLIKEVVQTGLSVKAWKGIFVEHKIRSRTVQLQPNQSIRNCLWLLSSMCRYNTKLHLAA